MDQQTQPSKKTAAKRKAAGVAAMKGSATQPEGGKDITPEQRHLMIAEAAYLIAEQRGFQSDTALDDWLQAEAEVDARFAAMH